MLQKTWINRLSFFILILTITTISTPVTSAQTELPLIIHIYDSNSGNESTGYIFFEGRSYDILVSSENETFVLGANISFLGNMYTTSAIESFITILAPPFNNTKSLIIKATKEGYSAAEVAITVMKGQLSVITDQDTIEEKKIFQVSVKDQDNKPVEGAFVYITPKAAPVVTDPQGIASIQVPDVEKTTTANIEVIKNGYVQGSMNIQVENIEGFVFNLTESQLPQIILPIIIVICLVNFALVYIIWRKKRISKTSRQTTRIEQSDANNLYRSEKQGKELQNNSAIYSHKEIRNISDPSLQSSVEETQIPIKSNKKEATILSGEEGIPRDINELRTIIKIDQPPQEEHQKDDDETPVLKKDLEEKKDYLKALKDFDFRINENKEKVDMIAEKVKSLSRDLDDLVSLYEIVSDQMNPFVGLSRVTKDRIDALEHYTEEIKELKTRLEQLEISNRPITKNTDTTPQKKEVEEKHTPTQKQSPHTNSHETIHTTDTEYTDQELDTILDESLRTLQPLRNIEKEIIDFLDKIT